MTEAVAKPKLISIDDYEPLIGAEAVDRIRQKAKKLGDFHITNVNSTYYGGGVAELLVSMTVLMNSLGIKTGWRTITGRPDFFNVTKEFHNALQSADMDLTTKKKEIYEGMVYENSVRMHLEDHDTVVIHDPQPLPIIQYYKKKSPWVWRAHIDLSNPNKDLWNYLQPYVNMYDSAIFSIKEYSQKIDIPQRFMMPAIDPFSTKNRELSDKEMDDKLKEHNIPTDLPIVCQISRYDRWKDPEGVIMAFKKARDQVKGTLVLLGNSATDDPEGQEVFESVLKHSEDRIIISCAGDDTALVNTLQKRSAVIMQKSTREGFGLTVTEAMVKGTPVIGGKVGGIIYQIKDGENGFLVSSIDEAAECIVKALKDEKLRSTLGANARQSVIENFLQTRLVEQYIDLFLDLKKPSQSAKK